MGFASRGDRRENVGEETTAAILYTSGTTGQTKGVMLTHRNLVTNALGAIELFRLGSSDVSLCVLPMFHSFAWTGCVLVSLALRAKMVISPTLVPAQPWLKMMGRHGVSVMAACPSSMPCCQGCGEGGLWFWFFRRLRMAISGAAPVRGGGRRVRGFGVPVIGLRPDRNSVATANRFRRGGPGSVSQPLRRGHQIVDDDERGARRGGGEICIRAQRDEEYHNLVDATADLRTAEQDRRHRREGRLPLHRTPGT